MTLELLKSVHTTVERDWVISENFRIYAETFDTNVKELLEHATNVLAGFEKTTSSMNPRSVAAFMAGIEKIANMLPNEQLPTEKKMSTIRLLQAAAMKFDDLTKSQLPNPQVVKIAQFGAGDQTLMQKYLQVVQAGPRDVANNANRLKHTLDQAITSIQTTNQQPQGGQQQVQQKQPVQGQQQPTLKLQPQGSVQNTQQKPIVK